MCVWGGGGGVGANIFLKWTPFWKGAQKCELLPFKVYPLPIILE